MTTIINTPGNNSDSSGVGVIVAIIIAIVVIGLFFVYGLPAIRGMGSAAPQNGAIDVNVKLPTPAPTSPAPTPTP